MQKIKNWDKIQIPREMRLKHPNGGYSGDVLGDICDEGLVEFEYKAYEIK